MKTLTPTKFVGCATKIDELKRRSPRFLRIFSEYTTITDEIWNLQTSAEALVTDDFLNAIKMQAACLEDEIEDWLSVDDWREEGGTA